MTPVHEVNAFAYLRDKLRPRELSIARAFLAGDLPKAKALLAYDQAQQAEPFDDIPQALGKLQEHIKQHMQPEAFRQAHEMIVALIARCNELTKAAHQGMNETTAGGPPVVAGKPELAQDSMRTFSRRPVGPGLDEILNGQARRDAAEHKRSRARLQEHLARIRIL